MLYLKMWIILDQTIVSADCTKCENCDQQDVVMADSNNGEASG